MIQDCPGGLRVKAGRAHMERVIILHACPIMPLHFVSPCLCATTAAAAAAAALRRWTCKLKFCSRAAVCSCSLTVNTLRQVNGWRVARIYVQSWIICLCHAISSDHYHLFLPAGKNALLYLAKCQRTIVGNTEVLQTPTLTLTLTPTKGTRNPRARDVQSVPFVVIWDRKPHVFSSL